MRLVEFVSEAQGPGLLSRIKAKLGSSVDQGKIQTQAEFSKIFKAFETWLGRSGLDYGKTLTVEKFKLNFGKTPNLDQALEDVGITDPAKILKKPDVEKILYRVTQLKDQAVSKPAEPSAPDTGAAQANLETEKLSKLAVRIRNIKTKKSKSGTAELNTREYKKIERIIKTEVSKSRQKAIEIAILLLQLSKTYEIKLLPQLWLDAYGIGKEWDTLKEVRLTET